MPTKKVSSKRSKADKAAASAKAAAGAVVATWEDDPGDPKAIPALTPITVQAPKINAKPLPFRMGGPTPAPKIFQPGTSSFRFYAAAVALRRTADFWGAIVPPSTKWQVGNTLPVVLDDGVDLNAFYTRGGFGDAPGLHFFHDTVGGRTFFSGESPDVACHEMGHAFLDAIRPQLFDVASVEAAAFHESFGDMTAILSNLQIPSFRQTVFNETQGKINRASRLSRLAEQLGAAIRVQHPDAVARDCLRNAANSFFYRDPQTIPPSGPASQLSSEPHSFSRVFTAAFLDLLAGIFSLQRSSPTSDDLVSASQDAGRILVAGILAAPVVPDYYSQVAAHMIEAGDAAPFNGKYRNALRSAFVRRGILSLQASATVSSVSRSRAAAMPTAPAARGLVELPKASISGTLFGLTSMVLSVHTAEAPKRFGVTSSSLTLGPVEPSSPQTAAESFAEDLFQRGRVDAGALAKSEAALVHPLPTKTHVITQENGDLVLKRRTFDCGFD
ncbi:MAG TPA: hypothetical protein VFB82_11575 [Blastocatellia bacterium]|nr:hypothetical protein [Blastocatellia bacterium]